MAQRSRLSAILALALLILPVSGRTARAALDAVVEAIVGVRAEVPGEARTADTLGRERRGSGVLIDESGLVLTIGYLILEASAVDLRSPSGSRVAADVVAYDHESGFGLLRASLPLDGKPLPLGDSDSVRPGDPLLVLANVEELSGLPAKLADRRSYAGYWEYLLDDALFTTPPFPLFGGAALIDREGRLVGIGSLAVSDAAGAGLPSPGNMFLPINALKPLLGDLLAFGRRSGPGRPWIGVYAHEVGGRVVVAGVAADSPAAMAGVRPGDMLVAVGEAPVTGLAGFYRTLWASGDAGATVALRLLRPERGMLSVPITSIDRLRWLRLRHSF